MQRFTRGLICLLVAMSLTAAVNVSRAQDVLTLDQCIDLALTNRGSAEFGLPGAHTSYHRAQQGVWSAWGNLLPSATYGASYSRSNSDSYFDQNSNTFIEALRWSSGLSIRQTVFDGGANAYGVAAAYHSRAAARENYRATVNNLVFGVKEAYFNLLKAIKLVEVQDAAVDRAEESHKTIRSKYELGSASLSEVLKAEVQLGTEQLELLRRQNEVESARARLNTILGRSVDEPFEIEDIGEGVTQTPDYQAALAEALENSPEVQGARAALRLAKDDIGIARASLFPNVGWSYSRGWVAGDFSDLMGFDQNQSWRFSLSADLPLFSAFSRKTMISNARVGVKNAREQLEQSEHSVELGVKQSHLGVELAQRSREVADQTEASAQEDFKLAQEKYNLGAATILDLLDAQASLTSAQNEKVNSLYDHYVAVARLENVIGRGR